MNFDNFVDPFDSAAIVRALEKAMDEATCPVKALLITNPHNPLGRCYSENNLLSMVEFCGRQGLHLISDEVYALSIFDRDSKFVSVLSLELDQAKCATSQIHVLWTMSKDFGCSGVRMVSQFFPSRCPFFSRGVRVQQTFSPRLLLSRKRTQTCFERSR